MSGGPYVSCNGVQCSTIDIAIPLLGAWVADVELVDATALSGAVSLVLGNLTLAGTVLRAGAFGGVTSARLVAGAGGWGRRIPAQGYTAPSALVVLGDAARACGELVALAPGVQLAAPLPQYVRQDGPASWTLRALAGTSWWVDAAGVTQVGPRPHLPIASPYVAAEGHGGRGWYRIATEDPLSWQPGATFTGPTITITQTISMARHHTDNDGVARLEVLVK